MSFTTLAVVTAAVTLGLGYIRFLVTDRSAATPPS